MDISGFTISIVGLGLMGGSLAKALHGRCDRLLGVDPDPETLALADRLGIFDRTAPGPETLLDEADLIVLALPIGGMLELISQLPRLLGGGPLVLDLGSTKRNIAQALAALPERFDVLPAHPICGKETAGLEHAEAGLFEGAAFVLSPLPRTTENGRRVGEQLVQTIGARLVWMDPDEHDRLMARSSHLPYLLACALALSAEPETNLVIGPGFRSTTRLAGTQTGLGLDMLLGNRDNLLEALRAFRAVLDDLEADLERADRPDLQTRLAAARRIHQGLAASS
jgi:prephenate dehydrogenase